MNGLNDLLRKIRKGSAMMIDLVSPMTVENSFLFMSAFPKSASSFTELVLMDLTGYSQASLNYAPFREQDLDLPKLLKHKRFRTITKQHTLATYPNVELFQRFQIRPVLITRKIPDLLLSLRDHILRTLKWPHFQVPHDFSRMHHEDQFSLLVDLAIPWYIFFYASWKNVEQEELLEVKFVTYENFKINSVQYFMDILGFWNFYCTPEEIGDAIDRVSQMPKKITRHSDRSDINFESTLSRRNIERILGYTNHYKEIDFSAVL